MRCILFTVNLCKETEALWKESKVEVVEALTSPLMVNVTNSRQKNGQTNTERICDITQQETSIVQTKRPHLTHLWGCIILVRFREEDRNISPTFTFWLFCHWKFLLLQLCRLSRKWHKEWQLSSYLYFLFLQDVYMILMILLMKKICLINEVYKGFKVRCFYAKHNTILWELQEEHVSHQKKNPLLIIKHTALHWRKK